MFKFYELRGKATIRWIEPNPAKPWLFEAIITLGIKLFSLHDLVGFGAGGRIKIYPTHNNPRSFDNSSR